MDETTVVAALVVLFLVADAIVDVFAVGVVLMVAWRILPVVKCFVVDVFLVVVVERVVVVVVWKILCFVEVFFVVGFVVGLDVVVWRILLVVDVFLVVVERVVVVFFVVVDLDVVVWLKRAVDVEYFGEVLVVWIRIDEVNGIVWGDIEVSFKVKYVDWLVVVVVLFSAVVVFVVDFMVVWKIGTDVECLVDVFLVVLCDVECLVDVFFVGDFVVVWIRTLWIVKCFVDERT